jgi:hypothetical protein
MKRPKIVNVDEFIESCAHRNFQDANELIGPR